MKNKAEQLKEEKEFIILKSSNYHYDLGIEHEKEEAIEIIDNKIKQIGNVNYSKTEVILALEEIKNKLTKKNQR